MGKARILVVEDNADNLALIRFLLEHNGYDVEQACDGLEGERMAKEVKPDLIIMDIAIPEQDGVETTRAIKSNPVTSAIPIVALTARTLANDRRRAMEAGCSGYITKPVNVAAFLKDVDSYLQKGEV